MSKKIKQLFGAICVLCLASMAFNVFQAVKGNGMQDLKEYTSDLKKDTAFCENFIQELGNDSIYSKLIKDLKDKK